MSQFYEGTPRPSAIRPNRPIPVGTEGITESLTAPGLATPVPRVSRGVIMLGQLDRILASTATVVGTAGAIARQDRLDAEQEQRRLEESGRRAEVFLRGQQVQNAKEVTPALVSQIEAGTLVPPAGVTPEQFAAKLVADRNHAMTTFEQQEFKDAATPTLLHALYARQDKFDEENNKVLLATAANGVIGQSPEATAKAQEQAQSHLPNVPALEIKGAFVNSKLKNAVALSDLDPVAAQKELDSAAAYAGPDFTKEVATARGQIIAGKDKYQADRSQAVADTVKGILADQGPTAARAKLADPLVAAALTGTQRNTISNEIDAKENQDAREAQTTSLNALSRDVALDRWIDDSPQKTVAEIVRRMDIKDPKDPNFVNAEHGASMLTHIEKKFKTDQRVERVRGAMGGAIDKQVGAPMQAIPEDDNAIIKAYTEAGIVSSVQPASGDKPVLLKINDPRQFAFFSTNINRVPNDAAQMIGAGLSSVDPARFADAASVYGALYLRSPHLARGIDMDQGTRMKARMVETRLETLGAGPFVSNEELNKAVAGLSVEATKIKPELLKSTNNQMLGALYAKDSPDTWDKPGFFGTIKPEMDSDITGGIFNSSAMKAAGVQQGRNIFGHVRVDQIPSYVSQTYYDSLAEELKIQRSLTPNDATAEANAKAAALDRTLIYHPPLTWNGSVYFQQRGAPSLDGHTVLADATQGLTDMFKGIFAKHPPANPTAAERGMNLAIEQFHDDLQNNYTPAWETERGGFVWRSNDGGRLKMFNRDGIVQPFVSNPLLPTQTAQTPGEQALEAIARFRANKHPGETDEQWARRLGRERIGGGI